VIIAVLVLLVEIISLVFASLRGRHGQHKSRIGIIAVCVIFLIAPGLLGTVVTFMSNAIGGALKIGQGIVTKTGI
jgi:hypothetical protein